ncbi:LysR family transcriptional regulator [Alicyclobacillus cycloheptanicus]|uniref:LysR family transcriptional repressor of citA n=1 Tax=Alicyclobacillus cycloheptanicus TaxID=1457 RepID=A0ABT9XK94_9BACL|nr:LysR family transcriptional regulator [Alicyclobacillus cycloheptanicus]MDQ0190203.1 LysR family transcriptional repressor of citA [Alicyclobacillus cycloheptanicus]WDM02549.1 LysR family transcriptional regulator [Alicyclobacillus cycloheptanicus]
MDIDWLHTFLVAAAEENFRRASEKLHLAQPTVSMHIDKLEQALGVKLFDRVGRTVRLNRYGRRFLPYAEQAIASIHSGEQEIVRFQQGYEQTLTLSVSPLIATTYLPRWIRAFSQHHENVAFSVQVMESKDIAQHVAQGQSDVGFSRMPSDLQRVASTVLYDDPVVAVAPADAHDLDGPPETLAELLLRYPLLTHNHPGYWDDLLLTLRDRYPAVRTLRVSQVHVTVRWIEESMGVSFLPTSTVRRALVLGSLMEVPLPEWPLPVAHTYLLQDPITMSPIARTFSAFVQAYMHIRSV